MKLSKFNRVYSTEDACLRKLFDINYGNDYVCPKCNKQVGFFPVKGRKCYGCRNCRHQIYPTKGTIMERSNISPVEWFAIIYNMQMKAESALSIASKYGITYKVSRRICMKIREGMSSHLVKELSGTVQIDESFIGGRKPLSKNGNENGIGDKQIVFGMIEPEGYVLLFYIERKNKETIRPLIKQHIKKGSLIHHDNNATYGDLSIDFTPKLVKSKNSSTFSRINNNCIENTWKRLKHHHLNIYGTVSDKYFQLYLDEFCFRHNHKGKSKMEIFEKLISKLPTTTS